MKLNHRNKIYSVLLFSFILFLFLIISLIVERYFKLIDLKIRKDTIKKEVVRKTNEDRILIKNALEKGYSEILYPLIYRSKSFKKLVNEIPPLGGNPFTKQYLCNEGYGLIKYYSDRFGFRNKDFIWDKIDSFSDKIILVGDSFAHGSCVNFENSIAGNLKESVFNISMGGNDPYIYNALVNVFVDHINPDNLIIIIYDNDFENDFKNDIFEKIVSKKKYICENAPCSEITNTTKKAQMLINEKKFKSPTSVDSQPSLIKKLTTYLKFKNIRKRLNFIKKKYINNKIPNIFKTLILNSKEKCEKINCNLLFVYIPNSETYRPNILAKQNKYELLNLLKTNKINFIDMSENFENFDEKLIYAINGPHLSPFGYKLVAKKINTYISLR